MDKLHVPVLLHEVLEYLEIQPTDTVVDGTFGRGGHAKHIVESMNTDGHYIGIDTDKDAVAFGENLLEDAEPKVSLVHSNFRHVASVLDNLDVVTADKFLFDFGLSSDQLDNPERGLSFRHDAPLDMRLSQELQDMTAADVVNSWSEQVLQSILKEFADESFYRQIVRGIVAARESKRIETTFELVDIISANVSSWYRNRRTHFATKTFQALRMAVNDELGAIEQGLESAIQRTVPGGRIAVITFHSVEDRLAKRIFRTFERDRVIQRITKKVVAPTKQELDTNRRSRSAKLRVIEKL